MFWSWTKQNACYMYLLTDCQWKYVRLFKSKEHVCIVFVGNASDDPALEICLSKYMYRYLK